MNSYDRIYELLLEEAFLLEQRKPLSWKQKLGAGVLGAAALFGAGKGMRGTPPAKASPTTITRGGIKFKTDYNRGSGVSKTTSKPKNPYGTVPRFVWEPNRKGRMTPIARNTTYGASLDWDEKNNPNKERDNRIMMGRGNRSQEGGVLEPAHFSRPNPDMPDRNQGNLAGTSHWQPGPPQRLSDKARKRLELLPHLRDLKYVDNMKKELADLAVKPKPNPQRVGWEKLVGANLAAASRRNNPVVGGVTAWSQGGDRSIVMTLRWVQVDRPNRRSDEE